MIELRPRKSSRLHSAVSGSDRVKCDCAGAQGVPRGRKQKIRTPVQCKQETGVTVSAKKGLHASLVVNKIKRTPRLAASGSQAAGTNQDLPQRKKRERKAKRCKCEITPEQGHGSVTAELGRGTGGITHVSLGRSADVERQAGSAQDKVASGQVKWKGRKPKVQPRVKCKGSETGGMSCANDIDPSSRSKEQEQVSVWSIGGSQPGSRKKRGRKAGSHGPQSKSPHKETKGVSGAEKVHTLHVRVHRTLLGQVLKTTSENVKQQHPEPLHREESKSTEPTCVMAEPRNSRRTKRFNVAKRSIPVGAEQTANYHMIVCEQSSMLKDEVKSKMSKDGISTCSTETCHVHSLGLPNPVVKLKKCKNLDQLHYSSKRLGNMLTTLNTQNKVSLTDSVALYNVCISSKENVSHNEEVVKSASAVNKQNNLKEFLKVKFNFRKRKKNNNSCSEERDSEITPTDCKSMDLKREGQQHRVQCIARPTFSKAHNGNLSDNLNNNTIIPAGQNSTKEQNKAGTDHMCNPWGSWRKQIPFASDEEISDQDFDRFSFKTVCSSKVSQTKGECTVPCQRVIPFTGKSIWKCSCARTYVTALPRRKPTDIQNTVISSIEAERSLEIYTDDIHSLYEGIQERTSENNSEVECKKRKLDVESTSTSHDSTLDKSLSNDNKSVSDALIDTSDPSLFTPLTSEPPRKDMSLGCSKHSAPGKVLNDEHTFQQLEREDTSQLLSLSPSKTVIDLDHKTVADPVCFKIINEMHEDDPLVRRNNIDLLSEVCSLSTPLEKVDTTCVLNDNLQSSNDPSDCEASSSKCYLSEWIDKGDQIQYEACDASVFCAPASSKVFTTNYNLDLLKAYEEDVLVVDVIPDDPELFGFSVGEESSSSGTFYNTNNNSNNNVTISKPDKMSLIPKVQKRGVFPAYESKMCVKRIEYVSESSTDSIHKSFNVRSAQQNTCNSIPETKMIKTHAETEESRCPAESQDKGSPQEPYHTNMSDESEGSPPLQDDFPSKHLSRPWRPFSHQHRSTINNPPQWIKHDFHFNRIDTSPPEVAAPGSWEKWRHEKPSPRIQPFKLPYGYCRYFFNHINGCKNKNCAYLHIPRQCDEKVCMDLLHKLINEKKLNLAAWIFRSYYSQYSPRQHYDRGIFGALLNTLLNFSMWKDLFDLLETAATAKIFPSFDQIINVFEKVVFSGLQTSFSTLLDIFCKFIHNGMNVSTVEISHIITILRESNASQNHINILLSMKSSLEMKIQKTNWTYSMEAAMSDLEHCKVNSDWMKLGTVYLTVCTGCENLTTLKNFSRHVAEALMKDSINDKPEIPFCDFAVAVFKNPKFDDIKKNILGRIGISVMFFYHHKELWLKGKKVIYKLHELNINYTILKGLCGQESTMSRCHVVNIAVEIFLKCGNLGSAVQTLKECEWIINTPMWPCDMMDVLHRHNLLCLLVEEALSKNMFIMCFDILQNLPGFQESQDVHVAQYAVLFNKVLNSCVENRSIGISTSIIKFMIAKNISIEYGILRGFITTLGHCGMWTRARECYKSAMALGFYSLFERKMNPKILYIPSFMSEVEMLITIEQFMVSNASSMHSQSECNQGLQIVLKRMEENTKCKDSYHAAAERLSEASRLSCPRLFIKHMTVNNTNEQVYTLDNKATLKWLNENMKWAGAIWH
ncbi:protein TOPAZ1 isoform X2 [Hyla sarda]|uniref:protein TOPAZ1 isoform X2 n=1 Tax=Hyla sarda TaxID=327740 RepID=UPI0024C3FA37|nr:protein TOPAZ1 isoform X2 [Hyla sarda]